MPKSSQSSAKVDRNHLVAAVANAFEILEIFGAHQRPISFTRVVEQSGKPRGSVHRVLSTLVQLGVLRQTDNQYYELTFKLWSIGASAIARVDLVSAAMPHIEWLMKSTGETAHLAVLDGHRWVTYLCKVESQQSVKVEYWIGKRVPAGKSASGRAILAYRAAEAAAACRSVGQETTAGVELARILRKVAMSGHAVTKGDNHPELGGIAAPVRDHTNQVVASCGIAVPAYRMNRALFDASVPRVVEAADVISCNLGHLGLSGPTQSDEATRFQAILRDVIDGKCN